jgi:hypothetical protein
MEHIDKSVVDFTMGDISFLNNGLLLTHITRSTAPNLCKVLRQNIHI